MKTELQRLRWPLVMLAFIGFAWLVGSALARTEDTGTHGAFNRLQQRAGVSLNVHWNAQTDVPDFLTGVNAADRVPYTPSAAERGNPVAIARGFLDENRALFKLTSAAEDFATLRVESDTQLGYAHVRLAQSYKGIPVFGKQLVVHVDKQDKIVAVNGSYIPEINVTTKASLSAESAEQVALKNLMQQQLTADERATVESEIQHAQTKLMVYIAENGQATLTWYIVIMTTSPLGQWNYFVNAGRPVVVHAFDSVENDKDRRTYTADNRTTIPGRLLAEEGERTNDDVAQAAHDNAGKVYDYYFNTFQRDGIDGQGSPMVSTVHFGSDPKDAQNAAWIGQRQQMIYGDGGKIFKPLSYGLDVVGHEFTHGVTDATSQLIYQGQSGALNESYSDVFGAMIDRANWQIGETVIKSPPYPVPYLRDMVDPTAGGRYDPSNPLQSVGQPASMSQYANLPNTRTADNGGVHVNSGIPNRAAYLIGNAIGKEKLEQIYYRTNTQYNTPDTDFVAMARNTIRAAQDLYGAAEVTAVQNGFTQVGLNINAPAATPTPSGTRRPATPTPSRGTPVPTQQPVAGCNNVIVNPGFETQNSGWVEVTNNQTSIIDTELPHSGSRSAWLGGTDEESLQYIYQDLRLPANATSIKLNFFWLLHEELTDDTADPASFWAVIANTNGDPLATIDELTSTDGDDNWHQTKSDISQFAGKTIRLAFIAENTPGNISSYFVDDVEVLACTSGPVSQPTPSGQNVVVSGIIKDASTGRGINGGQIFIMKPGITASDAASDDTVTDDEVLTFGTSDSSGFYQLDQPIPRNATYSAIVIASGYRPIVADNAIKIPANATSPYNVNATMRPGQ